MAEVPTLRIGQDEETDIREELRRLESVYPDWHAWIGVGLLYARRPLSSPPKVVSANDTQTLWSKVRERESRK